MSATDSARGEMTNKLLDDALMALLFHFGIAKHAGCLAFASCLARLLTASEWREIRSLILALPPAPAFA